MTSVLENFGHRPDCDGPTGELLCGLCAEKGTSCCRTDPTLAYLSFPLSLPEWSRLVPYSRLATLAVPADKEAFAREEAELNPAPLPTSDAVEPPSGGDRVCAEEENRPDFIASMRALFAEEKKRINSLFPENGHHRTLRIRDDGSCVFLGSDGCRLPRSVRPWYCLLFPAWVIGKRLTLFLSPDCLISRKARGPAHGIALLRSSDEIVRAQYAGLRKDWGLG